MDEGKPTDGTATLEERIVRLENAGSGRQNTVLDKALRYLPLFAVSNLLVSGPAFLISIGVAYFTFVQAEATEKMQIASVWPHVTAASSNLSDGGTPQMRLALANQGVGPAQIRGMEVAYRGKAYLTPHELLRACCVPEGAIKLISGAANGEVLRPGEQIDFVRFSPDDVPPGAFERFEEARTAIRVRVCYCSVFDDCWIADDAASLRPLPVEQCPVDWQQYGFPQSTSPRR